MRQAIKAVPDGDYTDRIVLDGFDQPLHIAVKVTVAGDRIVVDFDGTSPQVPKGINSVLNFTKAFTQYAMKCLLAPDSPNNDGSFAPIEVRAPEASIVHANFPAPVGGRHLVGLYIPFAIFGAMAEVLPDRVVADSSVLSAVTLNGADDNGKPYVFTFFSSGGMGARAGKDGLDATAFPSNVANVPVEVMEQSVPMLVTRRELIAGFVRARADIAAAPVSGSALALRTKRPATVSCMVERTESAPRGFRRRRAGRAARVLLDGTTDRSEALAHARAGAIFVLETPGGGGYGPSVRGDRSCRRKRLSPTRSPRPKALTCRASR